jgi:hypothetical protein
VPVNDSAVLASYKQHPTGAAIRANAQSVMCDECAKIDEKIAHYRELVARLLDPLTTERVGKLIDELLSQKALLHPEE